MSKKKNKIKNYYNLCVPLSDKGLAFGILRQYYLQGNLEELPLTIDHQIFDHSIWPSFPVDAESNGSRKTK